MLIWFPVKFGFTCQGHKICQGNPSSRLFPGQVVSIWLLYQQVRGGPQTPATSFPEEDLVTILTDESWLTLDTIGETSAPEDVFPTHHEDFKDFLY